jgi:hypothetical protein
MLAQAESLNQEPNFSRDVENLSPCRREALNSPLVGENERGGKGARGLGLGLVFPHDVKSQNQELARWEVNTPPTHFLGSREVMSSTLQARAVRFRVPNVGTPRRRESAAVRGDSENSTDEQLVALLPSIEPALTVSAYPTIFVSLPRTSAEKGEFLLVRGDKDEVLYETSITLPSNSGIVSVSLPNNGTLAPLEAGKTYRWYFFVIRNPQERTEDMVAEGEIQRVEPSPNLVAQLKNASPRDRAAIYAEAGVWYDAIDSIAQLRRSSPNDTVIARDWAELLKSVGLDTISQKPLLP